MEADLLVVQVCEFQDDGDAIYRLHEPARQLGRLPGVAAIDCDVRHRLLPSLASQADILILLAMDADYVPLIEKRRAAGRATVFEANDYFDDLQPWNPLTEKWVDRSVQDAFEHGLTLCDGVQTSTPELARRWRERTAKPIAVFPNQLAEIPPLAPMPDRPLTVGWGGSPGHFADWLQAALVLQPWFNAHTDMHLAVMTNALARSFIDLPTSCYHFTDFGSLTNYLRFLDTLDIGIAPLLPNDYNRCRSDVKYLEYASHGVVGIYADLEPYRNSVKHGETGFLYRTPAELLGYLDLLAGDLPLRERIRRQAYDEVVAHRRIENHIGKRVSFYRSLLQGQTRGCVVDDEILRDAVRENQSWQLRKGEPERVLAEAMAGPVSAASVSSLRNTVVVHPQYVLAAQQLARLLNDSGDSAGAMQVLEQARAQMPDSTRTLCELGRAHFLQGDSYRARQLLEFALNANPYFASGWFYLFRLLQLSSATDGWHWVERARKTNPRNYTLALFGLRLAPVGQAVPRLIELLEIFGARVADYEEPRIAATFADAFRTVAQREFNHSDFPKAVSQACQTFPNSAKLADLHATWLRRAGRADQAFEELSRANKLRLTAKAYQAEYTQEDGSIYFWQFGEHILKASQPSN